MVICRDMLAAEAAAAKSWTRRAGIQQGCYSAVGQAHTIDKTGNTESSEAENPITWKSVLLACIAILEETDPTVSSREMISAAVGHFLGFDTLARGGDMPKALRQELRLPAHRHKVAASFLTLTFFPESQGVRAKNG